MQLSASLDVLDGSGASARLQFASDVQQGRFRQEVGRILSGCGEQHSGVMERLGRRYLSVTLRAVGVGGAYRGAVK